MAAKNGQKMTSERTLHLSKYTPEIKNFVKIVPYCSDSEINVVMCFTQNFKMAAKNCRK